MKADYQSECRDDLRSAMTDSKVDCSFAPTYQDLRDFASRCQTQSQDSIKSLVQCGALPELDIFGENSGDTSCAPQPQDNSCAPVDNSCAPVDNSCPPVDNSCPPGDNSCPPIDNSCAPVDNSCPPGDTAPAPTVPFPGDNPTIPSPPPEAPPEAPPATPSHPIETPVENPGEVPRFEERPPLEGGRPRVELSEGNIPQELQRYAKYENGRLVIDAGGDELPPLSITRDDVTIRNARIKGSDGPAIGIYGANNVTVEDSEISGGQRGILADRSSNVSVKNNWLHDMSWSEHYDTTAVEFDYVSGGTIEGNKVTGLYRSDAISMFESQNLRVNGNQLDITIDEWSSSPMMVEGNSASGIEITNNVINYPIGNNVPPGILGGRNHRAENNIVNGNRTSSAWQLYAYNDVWENIYFDGTRIA